MDIYRQNEILGQLNAKARSDDLFKAMLLANPAVVLQTEGFPIPYGVKVKVVEKHGNLFLSMKGAGLDMVISMNR
jgi:hypothetical protein